MLLHMNLNYNYKNEGLMFGQGHSRSYPWALTATKKEQLVSLLGKNRRLVTYEPAKFEK